MALERLSSGAIGAGDAIAIALVGYVLLEPLDHVGAFFYVGMGGMAKQCAPKPLWLMPLAWLGLVSLVITAIVYLLWT